ncbi:MAG TPA: penicillin acylase family protein [Solirubrobacteraceae bacterium]|nr:penicillin acylase family protein [Solirubrobacteraceae bacterium]
MLVATLALLTGAPARAYQGPAGADDYGGFHSVLAAGQGATANAIDLANSQATGAVPPAFTNQVGLYTRLVGLAPGVTAANLGQVFKPAEFGIAPGQQASTQSPRPGTTIVRDGYGIPHVYGQTRADVMFGAGYASAQARLFLMDVLRHTARGNLSELIGAGPQNSTVQMDAQQLKFADYSEQELQQQVNYDSSAFGPLGQQALADGQSYVAGVNQYIDEAKLDPTKMPGEYAALGQTPAAWTLTDSVAVASLINEQQGSGGGAQDRESQLLDALDQRFGPQEAARVFSDLRQADDRDAPVTTTRRFPWPSSGPVDPAAVARLDYGSIRPRNLVVGGQAGAAGGSAAGAGATPAGGSAAGAVATPAGGSAAGAGATPAWLRDLQRRGLPLTRHDSNATLIDASRSSSGRALLVAGPQVGYYSPEILLEEDLHGGGIDAEGASFPGISQYVLLGHGRDFAWSATSAGSEQEQIFAEQLCNPDGSAPSQSSDHYRYRGQCVPFTERDHVLHTGPSAANPSDPVQSITLRTQRSIHGPVQGYATVNGRPVALALARSTYFHEADAAIAFELLNTNQVHDPASFATAIGYVNSSFNWFYADDHDIAYQLSGDYPLFARGVDPDLPAWGTGAYDWQGFDPAHYTSASIPQDGLPHDVNPARGYLISWNNKPAPGWRAASDTPVWGSVFRSQLLESRVQTALSGDGKLDLARLVGIMGDAATADLRGQEVYPWLRRVIGDPGDPYLRSLLAALDSWVSGGAHRRDRNGGGYYDEGAPVALMDAWWKRLAPAIFGSVLGDAATRALSAVASYDNPPGPQGDAFYGAFYSYVQKDLRDLLARQPATAPVPACRTRSGRRRDQQHGRRRCAARRGQGQGQAASVPPRTHRRRQASRALPAASSGLLLAPWHRVYCGNGLLAACRAVLLQALQQAAGDLNAKYHSTDPAQWRVPVTCTPGQNPPACDQIEFTTAGAISTPPIAWQNRGTFQQAVEVQGHRPR